MLELVELLLQMLVLGICVPLIPILSFMLIYFLNEMKGEFKL